MNKFKRVIEYRLPVFLLISLLSCTPEIRVGHLARLRLGMSSDLPPRVMDVNPTQTIQWSVEEGFEDYSSADAGEDTSYVLEELADDSHFYWRVLAFDPESDLNGLSNQTWSFSTAIPEPPSDFDLLELRTSRNNLSAISSYQSLGMRMISTDIVLHRSLRNQ